MAILRSGKPRKKFIKPKEVRRGWQNAYQELLVSSHEHITKITDKGVSGK